ncbi:MAG: ATP-binding protein [Minisyncoccia bacterium]|jgi:DNA helicase HerA-like ATPase
MSETSDIIYRFEKWLKKDKGMSYKEGSAKKRKNILKITEKILYELIKEDQNILKDYIGLIQKFESYNIKLKNKEEKESLDLFIEFIRSKYLNSENQKEMEIEIQREEEKIENKVNQENREIIGRVSLTQKSIATPTEFEFWSEDRPDWHIEIGDIVTVIGQIKNENIKIIGIINDMYATSATESPIEDFYSTGYGNASVELPTSRPIIRVAKVSIVYRDDFRFEPPLGNWPVFKATKEEIIEAYNIQIPEEYYILSGFTWDDQGNAVPIYLDSRFLLGYEGAHVNISGASGLATKTSYALFLIQSIISKTKNNKFSVAAILFNVKEADLMRIDEGPSNWENLYKNIDKMIESDEKEKNNKEMWEASKKEGVDPFFVKSKLKFFAPASPYDPKKPLTFRKLNKNTEIFSYGLSDLIQIEGITLSSLLDPEDLDEKTLSLISSLYDQIKISNIKNFKDLLDYMNKLKPDKGGEWISIGYSTHHSATLNKVRSRLIQAVTHQLKGLLLDIDSYGKPVKIEEIKSGDIWVVDISKLHSKGQRLVFMHIYETINKLLEAKKNKEKEIEIENKKVDLESFPDKIIVFVDELNKFAPSGRSSSLIKSSVIDITARGRSIGLSLIGAEQVANQIDEELLSNTSTFVVGRSHAISLKGEIFHWLQGGLKDKAMVLEKGDMILWHAVHSRPVLISFPKPIHFYEDQG